MNRKVFKIRFSEKSIGGWPCPTCGKGTLHMDASKFLSESTEESLQGYEDSGDPEIIDIGFSTVLNCSDSKCKEKVLCLGSGHPTYFNSYDEVGAPEEGFENMFEPHFFYPSLKIFDVSNDVPYKIKLHIYDSFKLFFCDPGAALNCLRIALEETLNFLEVNRFAVKNKKRFRISLHARIGLMEAKYKEIKDLCLAIKWHGNAGSHSEDLISKDDVLDAYEIFEVLMEKLFEKKTKNATILAKKINKQKGIKRRAAN